MNTPRIKLLKALNIIFFMATIVVNALSNTGYINNTNIKTVTYTYPNLFIPASYTFGIWGIIYFFLLLFCIYQAGNFYKTPIVRTVQSSYAKDIHKDEDDIAWESSSTYWVDKIGIWFIITCVLNMLWIITWLNYIIPLTVLIILLYLASVAVIYKKAHAALPHERKRVQWFVIVPFSIYLGWLSVATIANVTTWATFLQWNHMNIDQELWASTMIGIASILGLFFRFRYNDRAYVLVIIWATLGIAYRQYNEHAALSMLIYTCFVCIIILVISMLYSVRFNKRQPIN